jgi:hypothetical protein
VSGRDIISCRSWAGRGFKILAAYLVKPHKIQYYLERRVPEFKAKTTEVLHIDRDVELWRNQGLPQVVGVLSYDEKPGIQAMGNTEPDLPPVPGRQAQVSRDHEYKRYGTVSLLAGMDPLSGEVLGLVRDRHQSTEFIEFLRLADRHYPAGQRIREVLDNHSAHISKQTRAYLAIVPNRFEFIFTPRHGSRLNLIESFFFGKLARTLFTGNASQFQGRTKSCIELYLKEVNEEPVVFKWKYKLETVEAESVAAS